MKGKPTKKVTVAVDKILTFLRENSINDWNDFMKMKPFDKDIVNKLIDSEIKNMNDLGEVRFGVRLELSDRPQLIEYKKELEDAEEYEKCALIVKKLNRQI